MKTILGNLGLIVLGVLIAPPQGVISQGHSDPNLTADAMKLNAEELTATGTAWLNVRTFGAQGNGLTDDTIAIQNAINAVLPSFGSEIFFPPGTYIVSQITLKLGVSLIGSGIINKGSGAGMGTILQQKPGTDLDLIVSDQAAGHLGGYAHYSEIKNMQLLGQGLSGATTSSGINMLPATGEGFKLEHLLIKYFALDGVLLSGGVPFYGEDLHFFQNGVGARGGYGIEVNTVPIYSPSQTCLFTMISGDDNRTGLIHLRGAEGIGNHQSYLIVGVKAEKHTAGRQNDVIVLDSLNGSPVTVLGVGAVNTSGELANSVVKIIRSNARLFWFGLNRDNRLPNGYTYTVDDEFNRRSFKDSAGSAGTYGGSYYFDALSTAAPGSHFGQTEANGDLAGKISIAGSASGSHTFSSPFISAPLCTAAPTSDPGKSTWWVATTANAVTINLSTPARIIFTYHCFGNPD